ncbi:MAG: Gfo/Idh/MocA family oxidoreductase [Phycisphaeraceae bacterium]
MPASDNHPLKFAFVGFRHSHIMALHSAVRAHPDLSIVANCEEDPATAEHLRREGDVTLTHSRLDHLLQDTDCDVVAVGDFYAARGRLVIAALRAGRHVLADKPICTSLAELEEIASVARRNNLSVGCMLDLRASTPLRTMRRLIREGAIGEVHNVLFTGQHPLLLGSRPGWYFEPGKHGGTINDIAIHAIDLLPWLTGRRLTRVHAARAWNQRARQYPHFQDGAQLMLELDNGGGVIGDVSYLAPERCGYQAPQYWRFTCHGQAGVLEASAQSRSVQLATHDDKMPRIIEASDAVSSYLPLEEFLQELRGDASDGSLATESVLTASRQALLIQQIADGGTGSACPRPLTPQVE